MRRMFTAARNAATHVLVRALNTFAGFSGCFTLFCCVAALIPVFLGASIWMVAVTTVIYVVLAITSIYADRL